MQVKSEGPIRITRTTIEGAAKRRQKDVRIVIRDATCRGLALIINPTGISWRYDYRAKGKDPTTGRRWPMQSQQIGTPESHGPDAARDAAGMLKGQAKAGTDLAEERRQRIENASKRRSSTIERLTPVYEAALPLRPKLRGTGRLSARSVSMELDHLRLAIAAMGAAELSIESLGAADIRRMLTARATQPATARKHYGALCRFLDWALEERLIKVNPASLLPKSRRPRPVAARSVCPSAADLAMIWHAASTLCDVERDFIRLLICVPARLREVARMDWAHIDLNAKTWSLPATATKTRSAHVFHLPTLAVEILGSRFTDAGRPAKGLVLPSTKAKAELTTFTSMKRTLKDSVAEAQTTTESSSPQRQPPNWTFHDFRRSFASACAEAGVAESVADAILSHTQSATRGGVLGVYQRSTRVAEQVAAMSVWDRLLGNSINPPDSIENVIQVASWAQAAS